MRCAAFGIDARLGFAFSFARASLIATLGALGGCAHAFDVAPGYSIKEIPYAGAPFYWIDNESVFSTRHTEQAPTIRSRFDLGSAGALQVEYTHRPGLRGDEDGRVHAPLLRPRVPLRLIHYGRRRSHYPARPARADLETVVVKKGITQFPFSGRFNRYSCRWEERPKATQSDRGVIEVLRDDHGFIEAEHPRDPFPNRRYFLVPPSRTPIRIDFHGASGAPQYSSFKSAYAFKESISEWGATLGLKYWLVHPNGRVELTQIPPGEWRTGSVYAMPIRDSWFMTSLSMTPSAVGGYVVNRNAVRRVIKGRINSFDVSPDGCRIALYAQPAPRVAPRNAVLEMCRER